MRASTSPIQTALADYAWFNTAMSMNAKQFCLTDQRCRVYVFNTKKRVCILKDSYTKRLAPPMRSAAGNKEANALLALLALLSLQGGVQAETPPDGVMPVGPLMLEGTGSVQASPGLIAQAAEEHTASTPEQVPLCRRARAYRTGRMLITSDFTEIRPPIRRQALETPYCCRHGRRCHLLPAQ